MFICVILFYLSISSDMLKKYTLINNENKEEYHENKESHENKENSTEKIYLDLKDN